MDLFQIFTLPADPKSLSFTLVTWAGEDPQSLLSDAFGASLLDPTTRDEASVTLSNVLIITTSGAVP